MEFNAEREAIDLMLQDLCTRHETIRHKAGFKGCEKQLSALQHELIAYLERKRRDVDLWESFNEPFPV